MAVRRDGMYKGACGPAARAQVIAWLHEITAQKLWAAPPINLRSGEERVKKYVPILLFH